mmetsp:Transcript_6342/g.18819  ORF Transcript_6342/g.18819 Transcript_6342/m.18819 type:complete len:603 (-) Transcript_6342:43-1851(-)
MERLLFQQQLRGVLIYDDGVSSAFSAGNQKPGFGYSVPPASSSTVWNPVGGGFGSGNQFGMQWTALIQGPVFLLSDADAALVNQRYDESRNLRSPGKVQPNMLGARLEFFMWAAGDAKMCLRRVAGGDVPSPFCLPLGGWTAAGSLDPTGHSKPAIVVSAPMDAVALFHDDSFGANAGAAALAALTATARMLTFGLSAADRASSTKQVYFTAFQGEQFDFIGSTAFYNFLTSGNFPSSSSSVDPSNVQKWIEYGQLGTNAAIFLHNLNANVSTQTSAIFTAATSSNATAVLQATQVDAIAKTPPSSFRKLASLPDRNGQSNPFPSAEATLITDVSETAFSNQFFQSRLDNASNLGLSNVTDVNDPNIAALCVVVRAVVDTLATDVNIPAVASRSAAPSIGFDGDCRQIVLGTLQALLLNSSLPVTSNNATGVEYETGIEGDGNPINRYVSVYNGNIQSAAEVFMYFNLGAALQLPGTTSAAGCSNVESISSYHTMRTDILGSTQYCFNTSNFFVQALSPAFSVEGVSYKITDSSGVYSTWTESTWDEAGLQIFLMQDAQEAHAVIGGGVVYAIAVTVGVYFFNKKVALGADIDGPTRLSPNI